MVKLKFKAIMRALNDASRCGIGVALTLAILGAGCASQEEETAQPESSPASTQGDLELARVGDKPITLGQLQAFFAKMPDYLQSQKAGLEKQRRHLQTLIDMELLQLEAVERDVEHLSAFVRKVDQYRRDKLVGLYQIGKIRVRVTEQDVQDYFKSKGLSRQVRFARIVVASEDSARAARREIDAGQEFAAVAGKWSIYEGSAARGGDTGKYVGKMDLPPRLSEVVFALAEGEVSEPIDLGGAFALYKPLEATEAKLDAELYQLIYRQLFIERSVKERTALNDSLRVALNLERDQRGLDTFLAAMRRDATSGDQKVRALVLYRFDGGGITGGDLLDAAGHLKYESLDLRSKEDVIEYVEGTLAPDAIIMAAAVQEGLEQDEEVAGWLAKKWDQELVIQLRVQILEERVSISAEEIRREYDETPDRYTQPEQIEIQEILVDTEEEAQKLLERIQQGESIGELARKYSIRPPELRDEEGRRRFSTADGPVYGRLVSAAWKTPVDQFGGPLHVHEGYSVFKVLSRKREPASFEESKKRARAIVNWNKKQQVFDQFITGLRTKYAEQVTVREDNLKLAFAAE